MDTQTVLDSYNESKKLLHKYQKIFYLA